VNDFVDECRREWQRLRVPDRVADEMASELAADLADAAKDGASAEDVLGSAASDPRSFAASWAVARGAVGSAFARRTAVLVGAVAGLAAVAVSGAALLVVAGNSSPGTRQALGSRPANAAKPVWIPVSAGNGRTVLPRFGPAPDTGDSNGGTRTVGLSLLIVGVAGLVPLSILSSSRRL